MSDNELKNSMSSTVMPHPKENEQIMSSKMLPHLKENNFETLSMVLPHQKERSKKSSKAKQRPKETLKLRERNGATYQVPNETPDSWEELYESESECSPVLMYVQNKRRSSRHKNKSTANKNSTSKTRTVDLKDRPKQTKESDTRRNKKFQRELKVDRKMMYSWVDHGITDLVRSSRKRISPNDNGSDLSPHLGSCRSRVVTLGDYIPSFKLESSKKLDESKIKSNLKECEQTSEEDWKDWKKGDVKIEYTSEQSERYVAASNASLIRRLKLLSNPSYKIEDESYPSYCSISDEKCSTDVIGERTQSTPKSKLSEVTSEHVIGAQGISVAEQATNCSDYESDSEIGMKYRTCSECSGEGEVVDFHKINTLRRRKIEKSIRAMTKKAIAKLTGVTLSDSDDETELPKIPIPDSDPEIEINVSTSKRIPLCIHGIGHQIKRFSNSLFHEAEMILEVLPQRQLNVFAEAVRTLVSSVEHLRYCHLRYKISECDLEHCRWNNARPSDNFESRWNIPNSSTLETHDRVSFEVKLSQVGSPSYRLNTLLGHPYDQGYIGRPAESFLKRKYRKALAALEVYKSRRFVDHIDQFVNTIFREVFILLESLPQEEADSVRRSIREFNDVTWRMRDQEETLEQEERLQCCGLFSFRKFEEGEVSSDSDNEVMVANKLERERLFAQIQSLSSQMEQLVVDDPPIQILPEQCCPTVTAESIYSPEQCRPTAKERVVVPPEQYLPTVMVDSPSLSWQYETVDNTDGTQDLGSASVDAVNEETFIAQTSASEMENEVETKTTMI